MRRLHDAGMLEYTLEEADPIGVGMFFVKKKDGKLRLVVDGRRSNVAFREPDSVELATGSSFASLELGVDKVVYIGTADIKCMLSFFSSCRTSKVFQSQDC